MKTIDLYGHISNLGGEQEPEVINEGVEYDIHNVNNNGGSMYYLNFGKYQNSTRKGKQQNYTRNKTTKGKQYITKHMFDDLILLFIFYIFLIYLLKAMLISLYRYYHSHHSRYNTVYVPNIVY